MQSEATDVSTSEPHSYRTPDFRSAHLPKTRRSGYCQRFLVPTPADLLWEKNYLENDPTQMQCTHHCYLGKYLPLDKLCLSRPESHSIH